MNKIINPNSIIEFKAEGADTRKELAKALRQIADALDGPYKWPLQSIEDMDGSDWHDGTITTYCIER